MIFLFLFLTYYTQYDNFWSIHVAENGIIFVLFYFLVILYCVNVPHLLYLSLCRWTLGCLHILAIVNSVAMSIGVHVPVRIIIFSGYMPGVGFLGYMVVLFLVFKGIFYS